MSKHDVIQVLAFLAECYPRESFTEARAAIYVDLLKDIPGEYFYGYIFLELETP